MPADKLKTLPPPLPEAELTIKGYDQLTKRGRKKIVKWLRLLLTDIDKHGDQVAPQFTAGFHFTS